MFYSDKMTVIFFRSEKHASYTILENKMSTSEKSLNVNGQIMWKILKLECIPVCSWPNSVISNGGYFSLNCWLMQHWKRVQSRKSAHHLLKSLLSLPLMNATSLPGTKASEVFLQVRGLKTQYQQLNILLQTCKWQRIVLVKIILLRRVLLDASTELNFQMERYWKCIFGWLHHQFLFLFLT